MLNGPSSDGQEVSRSTLDGSSQDGFSLACQLPGFVYYDEAVFDAEMETIFQRTWQFVGREESVAKPGQYFTTQVGLEPLIVQRGSDGRLRAFHNVCPHRGAPLLAGSGSCKAIVCPYHAWSFSHTGQVRTIPRQAEYFPDLDPQTVTLAPASVDSWRGFIFANPDPEAEPLLPYLAEFPEFLDGYPEPYEEFRVIATFTFDEQVNWKIIVENYVEDYHFGFVHPKTLKVFDFEAVRTMPTGRHTRVLMPYRREAPAGHSKYPWDPSGPSYQGYLFPGTTFQTAKNHISLFRILPISARRTIVEIPVLQSPSQMQRDPIDLEELKRDAYNDMEEDFVICRQLQANVASSRFRINALASEHELGVAHFQRTWLQYMAESVLGPDWGRLGSGLAAWHASARG